MEFFGKAAISVYPTTLSKKKLALLCKEASFIPRQTKWADWKSVLLFQNGLSTAAKKYIRPGLVHMSRAVKARTYFDLDKDEVRLALELECATLSDRYEHLRSVFEQPKREYRPYITLSRNPHRYLDAVEDFVHAQDIFEVAAEELTAVIEESDPIIIYLTRENLRGSHGLV